MACCQEVFQLNKDLVQFYNCYQTHKRCVHEESKPLNLQFAVRVWYSKKLDRVGRSAINDVKFNKQN